MMNRQKFGTSDWQTLVRGFMLIESYLEDGRQMSQWFMVIVNPSQTLA